ncbi:TonB-dependent receptor domain-containing protein [Flavisolibacter tropicus]|uniref:Outer membrane protein beta-barrel domain-containing protein n=1 Tax=Flavisolibacter tropicus TaxID=1492898 RepID=A0A172U110_9BACT|nr:TonB-dependent receptor [Flavisolibacter tropicus]ANE53041.1 hypothetical protein SY85_23760 [Flavisolibacter tropicus]
MPVKTNFLLLLLAAFTINFTYGQEPTLKLSARIIGEDARPLPQATVMLLNLKQQEVAKGATDSSGRFLLTYYATDSCMLVVSFSGYYEYRSSPFSPASKEVGNIILHPSTQALQEVVIEARQQLIESSTNTITYNVSKSIDAQGISALEALKKTPGVYVNTDNTITLNGKAGVLILMDGRQTYLSGKELVDLLIALPASSLKSIEIMNSPTAKYDASGSSGIINIKTNKTQAKGFNGTITTGMAYGVYVRQNQDLSFNYRKNRFNIYGGYNHFLGNSSYLYGSDRIQNNKTYRSATDDTDKRNRLGARLGIDYTLNKNNTLGLLVNSNFIVGGGITRTQTTIGSSQSPVIEKRLYAENDYYYQRTARYNVNLNYKYEDAKGRILNVDADYGSFDKGNANLQSNIYSDAQYNPLNENFYHSFNDILIDLKALKADYSTNLWKGTLEVGTKYSEIASDNRARFFYRLPHEDSLDERRTNEFGFTEKITSAYVNYKKTRGKWAFQGGLRLENASSQGDLYFTLDGRDSTKQTPIHYTNLFPSFSVSVKPKQGHSFSLAYSRRIDRPAYQDLNPFIYLLDELSFWQGNPYLQPQLTHRSSLQYVYKSATIIGLHYAYTDQYSTRITDTLETAKIVMIPRNLGNQQNLSLSVTHNYSPKKWWEMTFNGTLYQLHNQISLDAHRHLELKQLASRLSLQQRFKLPHGLLAEVSGSLTTRRLTGANEISRGVSQVDLGIQRSFLNNKATLRLVFSDIYKGS